MANEFNFADWWTPHYHDIKGNLKTWVLLTVLGAMTTGFHFVVSGMPWWRHVLVDFLFAILTMWLAIMLWEKRPQKKAAAQPDSNTPVPATRPITTKRTPEFPPETLKQDALQVAEDLIEMLKGLGAEPLPKYTKQELETMSESRRLALLHSDDGDYAEANEYYYGDGSWFRLTDQGLLNKIKARWTRLLPWYEKVQASYDLYFADSVDQLRNRFTIEGIRSEELSVFVVGKDAEKNIRVIAAKLRELAYKVHEKGSSSSENA